MVMEFMAVWPCANSDEDDLVIDVASAPWPKALTFRDQVETL